MSCDLGMGFDFARPTTFEEPMFTVGDGVAYYGVDHSPGYLWNSATWGISEALIPFLRPVMDGPGGMGRRRHHQAGDRDPRRRRGRTRRSCPSRAAPASTPTTGSERARLDAGDVGQVRPSARCLMPRSIWRSITKLTGSTRCHITFMVSG